MFSIFRGYLKNSIATKLLKAVFVFYLIIAVTVTLFHITAEYYYMKDDVYRELTDLQRTFEPIIATALWNVNLDQLKSTSEGVLAIPSIVGVNIKDEKGVDIITAGQTDISSSLFYFEFQTNFTEYDGTVRKAGSVTFFSSMGVVFKRVQLGFLFIIINAIIKTIALWVIFLLLSRRLLSHPLAILTSATEKIDLNNLEDFQIDVKTSGQNELKVLEEAFSTMVEKLRITIAARHEAEKKLAKSEKMLVSIVKAVPDIIYRLDLQGRIIFINDAVKKYGYKPIELINKNIFDIVHPEDQTKAHSLFNKREIQEFEIRLFNNVSMKPVFFIKAEGLYNAEKQGTDSFIGTQGIASDITLQKQTEKEKLELEDQLRHSQKMEAIGTLAGGIAHDFNNILMIIIGSIELLMLKFPQACPERKKLMHISKASHRAKDLVKQILAFSRKSGREHQPIQIRLIVKDAIKFMQSFLPSSIEIHENISIGADMVMADPTQIHQVIMNFCTNARDAMGKKGGRIEITLSLIEVEAGSAHYKLTPGTWIELCVSDTGDGMDTATQERIFEPYYTTKAKGVGTGLGLAVVHGIVESCNGHITTDSEPGKGSAFHIFFPRIKKPVAPDADTAILLPAVGREQILLVDDEDMILKVGEKILQNLGYQVVTAICPQEALKIFTREPDAFGLVITDLTMPKMNGVVLAGKLLQIRPEIPIIMCTGFTELLNGDKTGIKGFLTKPYTMQQLSKAIRKLLG